LTEHGEHAVLDGLRGLTDGALGIFGLQLKDEAQPQPRTDNNSPDQRETCFVHVRDGVVVNINCRLLFDPSTEDICFELPVEHDDGLVIRQEFSAGIDRTFNIIQEKIKQAKREKLEVIDAKCEKLKAIKAGIAAVKKKPFNLIGKKIKKVVDTVKGIAEFKKKKKIAIITAPKTKLQKVISELKPPSTDHPPIDFGPSYFVEIPITDYLQPSTTPLRVAKLPADFPVTILRNGKDPSTSDTKGFGELQLRDGEQSEELSFKEEVFTDGQEDGDNSEELSLNEEELTNDEARSPKELSEAESLNNYHYQITYEDQPRIQRSLVSLPQTAYFQPQYAIGPSNPAIQPMPQLKSFVHF